MSWKFDSDLKIFEFIWDHLLFVRFFRYFPQPIVFRLYGCQVGVKCRSRSLVVGIQSENLTESGWLGRSRLGGDGGVMCESSAVGRPTSSFGYSGWIRAIVVPFQHEHPFLRFLERILLFEMFVVEFIALSAHLQQVHGSPILTHFHCSWTMWTLTFFLFDSLMFFLYQKRIVVNRAERCAVVHIKFPIFMVAIRPRCDKFFFGGWGF